MAKIIKMTPELQQECRIAFQAEFEKAIANAKFSDGKLSFTKTFGQVDRKASVYFTEIAWMKIDALLREFNKEVAWHATAYRIPGDKDEYLIKDILVYPQTVTASTVEMDTEQYAMWLMENCDDERFDNIRCQMHSHVNMGVFASSVDQQHQEEILEQLGSDDFYIFMIWNKRHDVYIRIFDMMKNVLFDTADITWGVLEDTIGLSRFIDSAKKIVKEQTFNSYANQGYGRNPNYNYSAGVPYNPVGNSGSTYSQSNNNSANKGSNGGNEKKKDKKKTKFAAKNACEEQMSIKTSNGDEFDMADPFGYHDGPFQIT